jgi:hypothetical protein
MRRIMAICLASSLLFTSVASAADMPVKAPPPPEPVVAEFCWACLLVLIPVGLCIAFCGHKDHRQVCQSPGGCFEVD